MFDGLLRRAAGAMRGGRTEGGTVIPIGKEVGSFGGGKLGIAGGGAWTVAIVGGTGSCGGGWLGLEDGGGRRGGGNPGGGKKLGGGTVIDGRGTTDFWELVLAVCDVATLGETPGSGGGGIVMG